MKNLKLSLDAQLEMMEHYKLNPEEYLTIELLFLSGIEERHREYLLKYLAIRQNVTSFRDVLVELQNKGIILKSYKIPEVGKPFDPECIEFNKNFLNRYRKYSGVLGKELYEEYPHFIKIDGIAFDIANFAKKFNSEHDFYFAYGKAIGWDENVHREVIDLVKWAKKNTTYLKFNICDFVISRAWRRIKELKDKGLSGVDLRFDNVESI